MSSATAAQTSNVTIIPPRPDNLHEAIAELHLSQITGDYRYSALALAGPLMSIIGKIFPLHMVLIYLTTSYKRRQVWNAYVAAVYANSDNSLPITDPDSVREKLMNTNSKTLIEEAYGLIPCGFQHALELLGLHGQQPHIYIELHEQMSKSVTLRKAYSHASKIEASTVTAVSTLPEFLKSFELALQFQKTEDIKKLVFAVDMLAQNDAPTYKKICADVVTASKRGHSVAAVLKREYNKLPFPDPIVPKSDQCRYIDSAQEMMICAKRFNNCLKQYISDAMRNDLQVYEFLVDSSPVAVISIKHDQPLGWRIYEVKTKGNGFPDIELMEAIEGLFVRYNVFAMSSMECLLRELGYLGVVNRGRRGDPVDEISQVIDELLDDDPA